MKYTERFHLLKERFDQECDTMSIPELGVRIENHAFHSAGQKFLMGESLYLCEEHGTRFQESPPEEDPHLRVLRMEGLSVPDAHFANNREFRYSIFRPLGSKEPNGTILLLHGLNERYWFKYLPWAVRLVELTGRAVCLFPIAFHMNRAPHEWGNPKRMLAVAEARRGLFPSVADASFANAAISARLQSIPQRFFWSGLQTYDDVVRLVRQIRQGEHPSLEGESQIDFFAYSVGSFLSQILLMSDEGGLFTRSRLVIFCGGPTFDRMCPVSRYIIDSEALIALYSFFVEHLENEFRRDARLDHYFNGGHAAGLYFKAMLANRKLKETRESRFNELRDQIMAVALRQDTVIQPVEVMNTLQGDFRDIPLPVHILDFPFEYTHMNPFPPKPSLGDAVDEHFDRVFTLAASHFCRPNHTTDARH